MDRIIIIDDKAIRNELEAFLLANQEHIRLNSDMDEVTLGTNPTLQEIIRLYENKYKVKIRSHDSVRFYRLNDIIRLESDGDKTRLILINNVVTQINETLDDLKKQLDDFPFIRTHKNHLVNLHHVIGIRELPEALVLLSSGDDVPIAEHEKEMIIETLNKFLK